MSTGPAWRPGPMWSGMNNGKLGLALVWLDSWTLWGLLQDQPPTKHCSRKISISSVTQVPALGIGLPVCFLTAVPQPHIDPPDNRGGEQLKKGCKGLKLWPCTPSLSFLPFSSSYFLNLREGSKSGSVKMSGREVMFVSLQFWSLPIHQQVKLELRSISEEERVKSGLTRAKLGGLSKAEIMEMVTRSSLSQSLCSTNDQ